MTNKITKTIKNLVLAGAGIWLANGLFWVSTSETFNPRVREFRNSSTYSNYTSACNQRFTLKERYMGLKELEGKLGRSNKEYITYFDEFKAEHVLENEDSLRTNLLTNAISLKESYSNQILNLNKEISNLETNPAMLEYRALIDKVQRRASNPFWFLSGEKK
ncbi:Uncharacterised protein [uncultured archaeon]|nr:Uncharacterised protein [uncultured archaeon]